MVRLKLEIKVELDGVTDLEPAADDFDYFFQCTSCREIHPKFVSLNRIQELEVSGGKHGTAHLIWRCSACKREHSAKFDTSEPVRPYTTDSSGDFSSILVVECRGLEFIEFDPTMGLWKCKGTESGTIFPEVNFQNEDEWEWYDYDEKQSSPVQITFLESRFTRA